MCQRLVQESGVWAKVPQTVAAGKESTQWRRRNRRRSPRRRSRRASARTGAVQM